MIALLVFPLRWEDPHHPKTSSAHHESVGKPPFIFSSWITHVALCSLGTACPRRTMSNQFHQWGCWYSFQEENITGVGKLLALFRDESVLPADGMVDPKDYEIARKNSRKFKDIFIGLAKDDEEKELVTKLWPYQEPADTEGLWSINTATRQRVFSSQSCVCLSRSFGQSHAFCPIDPGHSMWVR